MNRKMVLLFLLVVLARLIATWFATVWEPWFYRPPWCISRLDYNTFPRIGYRFTIRAIGEYDDFGSLKIRYDEPLKAGDWICVRVDADNDAYAWMAMVYWDGGMYQVSGLRSGETRCHKVAPQFLHGEKITEFTFCRIHWGGFRHGEGDVTARPVVIISDHDLREESGGYVW